MNNNHEEIMALRNREADNRKEFWSEEDRKSLKHMYLNGYGITEMALAFGRSEDAIHNQIHILNLQPRIRASYAKKAECKCSSCVYFPTCRDGICGPFEAGE